MTELLLADTEERYRMLVRSIDIGFCLIKMLYDDDGQPIDYLFLETNPAFEEHTGLRNPIGKTILGLAPDIDTSWFRIYGDVALTQVSVRFENHDPALGRWFDVYAQSIGQVEERKVGIFFTDISDRKHAEQARLISEEKVRDAQARLTSALSAGNIATWTLDLVKNRLAPDANFAPLFGVDPKHATEGPLDAYMAVIHAEDRQGVVDAIARAVAEHVPYEAEYRVVLPNGAIRWLAARGTVDRDADGNAISMPGVIVDVTERIERERRDHFLSDLSARTREMVDHEAILYETARALGEYTKAHRALYIEIDEDADSMTIHRDFARADEGIASMAGTYPLWAFGPPIVSNLRHGNVTQVEDTESDPRLTDETRAAFRATNFRSFLAAPLHKAGRFVAVLALQSARPRVWTSEEADLLTTVVERTWLAVENARQYRALQQETEQRREQGEYLRRLLESSPDCIKTLDLEGNILSMSEHGRQALELDDVSTVLGTKWIDFLHDDDMRNGLNAAIDVAKAGGTGHFQGFCPTFKGTPKWWDVVVTAILGADGKPEQLLGISRDVTEQKQSEVRERARLTDIFKRAPAFMATLRGPQHIFELANPPYFQLVGHRDILGKPVAEALPEVAEQGFLELLDHVYQTGEPFVGQDVPIMLQREPDGPLEERFLDFTYQPLFGDANEITGILAHGIDLTVRKRLEQDRERLLSETRLRADREELLNRIGAAVRGTVEPQEILRAALEGLGNGMGLDRAYFVTYNVARDLARVSPEWIRDGATLISIADRNLKMSRFSVDRDEAYKEGVTHVVDDTAAFSVEDAAELAAVNIRALLRVPMEIGDQMTALAVSMADEPRHWTQEEVRLVEDVATLLHTALESARLQQRERNIALQLQDALQPPPPSDRPGLALASYYRPALAEASVGGDFFDVFPDEEGCTALVVADLSGKGVQAASQVATVRNMMRYALYSSPTLAEAVTNLHQALVKHELLTGFATLFIGLYDERERSLTYVNCGQEAGLIWRAATGNVDQMPPTGTVLGGFGSGDFTEEVVALLPGDVLALFTDGLTEVGPTRKVQLEIEGVSDVLREYCAQTHASARTPQATVDRLIAGVDDFARGGARDDIALLVGVVV